jgi:hypothetical protein
MRNKMTFKFLEMIWGSMEYCLFSKRNVTELDLIKAQFIYQEWIGNVTRSLLRFFVMPLLFFTGINSWAQAPTINGFPDDWPTALNSAITAKTFVHDANNTNDNQFTGGSSDGDLIAKWSWSSGNTNNKGDVTNSGAILVGDVLYFFGDRTSINGDAQIGFWFFKAMVAPAEGGKFSGQHEIGDILVLSNFTNGGGSVALKTYEWVGSGGSDGPLNFVGPGTAFVNNAPIGFTPSGPYGTGGSWTYQGNQVPGEGALAANYYHIGAFFEGFIDLGDLDIDGCFSSYLLETRNSASIKASLQDFVGGSFDATPNDPTVTPNSRCGTGTVQLQASCSSDGTIVRWYDANHVLLNATGSPFITPSISTTTTYYAACYNSNRDCESDQVAVIATVNPIPTANAGTAPPAECPEAGGNDFNLSGSFTNGTALWTVKAGSATGSAVGSVSSGGTTTSPIVHVNGVGSVTFRLTVTSNATPSCGTPTSEVTVTVNPGAVVPSLKITNPLLCGTNPNTGSIEVCSPISGTSYKLYLNNVLSSTILAQGGQVIFTGLGSGINPRVDISTGAGCAASANCTNQISGDCPAAGLASTQTGNISSEKTTIDKTEKVGFVVYPVPFKDQLNVRYSFDYVSQVLIEVFNAQGVRVLSKKDTDSYLDKEISLNLNHNTGKNEVYFVKVTTDRGSSMQKVISSR